MNLLQFLRALPLMYETKYQQFCANLARDVRLPCTDPKSGLRPEMGKRWPKNGFWPHQEKGEKMAEKWENWAQKWVKNGHFPILRPFFPLFPAGAKIHFLSIFFPFRAGGPIWGLYRAIGIARLICVTPSWRIPPPIFFFSFSSRRQKWKTRFFFTTRFRTELRWQREPKAQIFAGNRRFLQIHPFSWKFKHLEGAGSRGIWQKTEDFHRKPQETADWAPSP